MFGRSLDGELGSVDIGRTGWVAPVAVYSEVDFGIEAVTGFQVSANGCASAFSCSPATWSGLRRFLALHQRAAVVTWPLAGFRRSGEWRGFAYKRGVTGSNPVAPTLS